MNTTPIPIFYACDDAFVKFTIVSLQSMIVNASPDHKYLVHILHTDISDEMKNKVYKLANDNFEIRFVDVTDYLRSISEKLPLRDYYSKTTYYRLFIAEMFTDYTKAIYIDSDTIVQGDISKLYKIDIKDAYVGACHEQAMIQSDEFGTYVEKVIGIPRYNFFNAGLMVINCEQFRLHFVLDKFVDYLHYYTFVVTQDEDYLNLICKDHVYWIDQRWNTEVFGEIPYPIEQANMIHYIMTSKPWHYENCRFGDIFWRYAKQTEVYDEMRSILESYTDEQKERDARSQAGRVLLPEDIDYIQKSFTDKLKTKIAFMIAHKFVNNLIKDKKFIIKEMIGLENFHKLDSGAVITCNHFNAFDSFAIQLAYEAADQPKRSFWRVIREGNYTSFPGFYGFLMRHCNTLPLSSNRDTMKKFMSGVNELISTGNFVLFYPEQSMWWNYRKPKPLKSGAYSFAVKNNAPVLPCFITMKDSDVMGEDGFYVQEYTIHIPEPIYPDTSLPHRKRIDDMMNRNYEVWKEIYEKEYHIALTYTTETKE